MTLLLNIAAAMLFWVPCAQALTAAQHSLELTSPKPGEQVFYYGFDLSVTVTVTAPPGDYEVELAYMGTVHFLPALGAEGGTPKGGLQRWTLRDSWLPFELGEHPLQLRLLSLHDSDPGASGRLLAETDATISYSYGKDRPPLEAARKLMQGLAGNAIQYAEVLDPVEPLYGSYQSTDLEKQLELAQRWMDARHGWFFRRVETLTRIADLYDHSQRPGDGLRAIRRAEAIWKAESGEILHRKPATPIPAKWSLSRYKAGPPHLLAYAGFYGRRMETERAVDYLKEAIAFMDEQERKHPTLDADDRRSCVNTAGGLMRKVANLHYLVRRDRAGYDLWKQRSKEALARSKDKPREGGLLDR